MCGKTCNQNFKLTSSKSVHSERTLSRYCPPNGTFYAVLRVKEHQRSFSPDLDGFDNTRGCDNSNVVRATIVWAVTMKQHPQYDPFMLSPIKAWLTHSPCWFQLLFVLSKNLGIVLEAFGTISFKATMAIVFCPSQSRPTMPASIYARVMAGLFTSSSPLPTTG